MDIVKSSAGSREIPYVAPLLGNIRQILTGLQGFDSMAREIVQNADDADAHSIRFDIDKSSLRVWNSEQFTTCSLEGAKCEWELDATRSRQPKACDFHAISTVGSGNKYRDPALIGRFGIGFVSVYQITDTPIIRSLDIQMELDPLREKNRITPIPKIDGSQFELPWAYDQESPIRDALSASALNPSDLDALQEDLIRVANDCLLFLRNLIKIEIFRDGKLVKSAERENLGSKKVRITHLPENTVDEWFIISADANESARPLREKYVQIEKLGRQTDIQIAFRLKGEGILSGHIFAYLPTEQKSPLPCHINADFFPEQNRKALVLSGEQHERYWNEMLLGVAATEISNHLLELREVLGPQDIWRLIGEAFEEKNSPHFGVFWDEISAKVSGEPIVWTSGKRWAEVDNCNIGPGEISDDQEYALTHVGLNLTNSSIRAFQNALQSLGVKRLTLSSVVTALEEWDEILLDEDMKNQSFVFDKLLPPLWSLTNSLFPSGIGEHKANKEAILRLKKVRLAPKTDETLQPIEDLYRLPAPIKNMQIADFIKDLPLVQEGFRKFDRLNNLVDLLVFPRFLSELSARIKSKEDASEFFGSQHSHTRAFYGFMSSFPRGENDENVSSIRTCPFLAGHSGFLSPDQAVLPGGFTDPVGRFDTLDVSYFDERSQSFLREVLNVQVLSLKSYVVDHLADVLEQDLPDDVYVALIEQIAEHRELLDDPETASVLEELAFVRSVDAQMHRAKDCYFKTKELAEILGNDTSLWIDTSLFNPIQRDLIQLFLTHLGMRTRPSIEHALDRIDTIVEHDPSEKTVAVIYNLFHFIYMAFEEEDISNNEEAFESEIERLKHTDWLPAIVEGELDTSVWYAPHELYQPFRSSAFDSQVPVLAIRSDRKRSFTGAFLSFLDMAALPNTSTVVDHLIHCIENEIEANDTVYQVLTEKLRDKEDTASLEKLCSQRCVYSTKHKKYVYPGRVFWIDPKLPRFCFSAPDGMHRHKELFDFLGVSDLPSSETYAGVLEDIAEIHGGRSSQLPHDIQLIHGLCLKELASHIRSHPESGASLLSDLEKLPFLLTLAGTLAFSDEVAVKDNDWLVEPFAGELDGQLIYASPEYIEILDFLRVPRLSAVTQIEVVRLGEVISDEDATSVFRQRYQLILRLLSSVRAETRDRIVDAFSQIEIVRTDFIQVRSVFSLPDPPIVSTPQGERVHFDKTQNTLYLHLDLGDSFWTPALKAMIAVLVAGDDALDIRGIALNAKQVLQASSLETAQRDLEEAGFYEVSFTTEQSLEIEPDELGEFADEDEQNLDVESQETNQPEEPNKDLTSDVSGNTAISSPHADVADTSDGVNSDRTQMPEASVKDGTPSNGDSDETRSPNKGEPTSGHAPPSNKHGEQENKASNSRTVWMRSYVVPKTDEENGSGNSSSSNSHEKNMAIDEAAMRSVIEFETNRQCAVERMPHFNPGYDAISRNGATGEKRLIEVKGLNGAWTERGVKLSRTQIMNAEEYGEEFWLYVVEHALDDKNRKVYAINNPFFKASEFWFDDAWKKVVDETGGDLKSRFVPGRKVRMEEWGLGTITAVQHRGIATNITIDFHIHGLRNIPLNLSRMELVED